ncbi:MAG TPA: TetR/AcrR family transcriptional regulator [Bacillota bacterium]|nr:TetR/AcrR family transcriptional regulator [Bacillota bacterium]
MENVIRNRTERKKEETRRKIIAVAMELFNERGYARTTVDQVAEGADVAKGTIFNHFPSKEAIVAEYVRRNARETGAEAVNLLKELPDTRSRLTALLQRSLEWFDKNLNRDVLKVYIVYMLQRSLETVKNRGMRSGFNNILEPIVRMGQEAGEIRPDISAEELSNHLEWISASVMILWLAYPEKPLSDIIEREVDLFLNGAFDRRVHEGCFCRVIDKEQTAFFTKKNGHRHNKT